MDAGDRLRRLREDRAVVAHRRAETKGHRAGLHGEGAGDEQAEHAAEVSAMHRGGAVGQERVRAGVGVGQERLRTAGRHPRELRNAVPYARSRSPCASSSTSSTATIASTPSSADGTRPSSAPAAARSTRASSTQNARRRRSLRRRRWSCRTRSGRPATSPSSTATRSGRGPRTIR